MSAIEVRHLTKRYGGADRPALDGLNLEVEPGTICALLGRNGAGKTTAIRILSTLLRFDEGAVAVAGFDVRTQSADVRRSIGLIGQHAALDEKLSGRTNLRMIARLAGLDREAAGSRANSLLEQFRLTDAADRPVGTYSGGMRRRLDLAAGLTVSPPVLLVDEPTTGLDPEGRRDLWNVIAELAAAGTTMLLTTQYLEEAERLADRVVVLRDGALIADGTAEELESRVGSSWVDLTFSDAVERDRAARWAETRWQLVHAGDDRLRVAVERSTQIQDVCVGLSELGLVATEITTGRPTLDDVFLQLHDADAGPRAVGTASRGASPTVATSSAVAGGAR